MAFARWVFRIAGIMGLLTMAPMYFLENHMAPGLTHPAFYYGFVGINLVWQILYLILATDPARYRPMMLPACAVKLLGFISIAWLFVMRRTDFSMIPAATADLVFAVLFLTAWRLTRRNKFQDAAARATL